MIDDLDLKKIEESGQCFRVKEIKSGLFRFVTGEHVVYVEQPDELNVANSLDSDANVINGNSKCEGISYSCSDDEWNTIWHDYFDFDRSYADVRSSIPVNDAYMRSAADCGVGIRILKQDPWEMLISFIISQRKAIPAIKSSIELLCQYFGRRIVTEYETIYLFPSAEEIAAKAANGATVTCAAKAANDATVTCAAKAATHSSISREDMMTLLENSDLKNCKLGYRLRYICDAVCKVIYGELDLEALRVYSSDELLLKLKEVYGVGDKVANCIALFAYGRTENAPVDTWIKKVIENVYDGKNPFPQYGENAGIMQQYIFYYALKHKSEF